MENQQLQQVKKHSSDYRDLINATQSNSRIASFFCFSHRCTHTFGQECHLTMCCISVHESSWLRGVGAVVERRETTLRKLRGEIFFKKKFKCKFKCEGRKTSGARMRRRKGERKGIRSHLGLNLCGVTQISRRGGRLPAGEKKGWTGSVRTRWQRSK